MEKVGRNEPCPCGSGKKYKNCHMNVEEKRKGNNKLLVFASLIILLLLLGIIGAYYNSQGSGQQMPPTDSQGRVWSDEHQHYH